MSSRFKPVKFQDFNLAQFVQIWTNNCGKKYKCDIKVTNVAARRIARGIGRKGFGNARSMRQLYEAAATSANKRFEIGGELSILVDDIIVKRPT